MQKEIVYEFSEEQEIAADKAASRLTEGGGYNGVFKKASAVVAQKGTNGIAFTFEAPGSGTCEFTVWTMSATGEPYFGGNFIAAMAKLMGVKKVASQTGKVMVWDDEMGERVERDGQVFECLCNKPIGVVLQKELYTDQKGVDRERLALLGVYHPETMLTISEMKERKTKPEKVSRLLKQAEKPKDQRKKTASPAQPSMGLDADMGF